jgi:hypothetical protein
MLKNFGMNFNVGKCLLMNLESLMHLKEFDDALTLTEILITNFSFIKESAERNILYFFS